MLSVYVLSETAFSVLRIALMENNCNKHKETKVIQLSLKDAYILSKTRNTLQ